MQNKIIRVNDEDLCNRDSSIKSFAVAYIVNAVGRKTS